MVHVGYRMLIAHPYHAIHTEKASSLVLEELLLQQRCLMQHLHVIPLSPGSGDELLLLGQATCCSQMAHEYFICLIFCMGMGCSLNTEKQKGFRNVQKNVHGWSGLQGLAVGSKVCWGMCLCWEHLFPANLSHLAALATSFQQPGAYWPGAGQHKVFNFF